MPPPPGRESADTKKPAYGGLVVGFGAKSARDMSRPVPHAMINGKIKASDVLSGFLTSNKITTKNILVANVVDE